LPKREGVLIFLLVVTGLRISEAVALRWSDFDGNVIVIRRYYYESQVKELEPGESAYRIIPVPADLRRILETLRESEDDDWIFRSRTGRPMNHFVSMRYCIKPILRKLNLPNIGWHDFRHTMISWLGKARHSPKMIADVVGHADVSTTLSVYTHSAPPEAFAALDQIAMKLFRDVPKPEINQSESAEKQRS